MNYLKFPAKLLPLIFMAIFLSGCVSPQIQFVSPIMEQSQLLPAEGIVTARVIIATDSSYPINSMTLVSKDVNKSKETLPLRLSNINTSMSSNPFFASAVKSGQYSISNLTAFYYLGEQYYQLSVPTDISLGTFSVKPGKVTDLGTLIYYPIIENDRVLQKVVRVPESHNKELIKAEIPFFNYDMNHTLTWDEDDGLEDRRSAYSAMVQNPLAYNQRYLSADKDLFLIGKLGTILIRRSDGSWDIDAIETNSDMHAISKSSDGQLLIGGDNGELFHKDLSGKWNKLELDPKWYITSINFRNPHNADIILKSKNEVQVSRWTFENDSSDHYTLLSYRPYRGWFDRDGNKIIKGISPVNMSKSKRKHIIKNVTLSKFNDKNYIIFSLVKGPTIPFISSTYYQEFSYDPESWVIETSKGFEDDMDYITNAGHKYIGYRSSFLRASGVFTYDDESGTWKKLSNKVDLCPEQSLEMTRCKIDAEKTVKRHRTFSRLSLPYFFNNKDGITFAVTQEYSFWARNYDPAKTQRLVLETHNGGESWFKSQLKAPDKYCTDTIPEIEDTLLVACLGASSDFYESSDQGKTWSNVREHLTF